MSSRSHSKPKDTNLTGVANAQPLDNPEIESKEQTEAQKPSSSKGRRRKPTRKELARRRREKAEQERLEAERKKIEEEERAAREREMELERQQKQRLTEESENIQKLRKLRSERASVSRKEQSQKDGWKHYIECDHTTDPLNPADVNSFISTWNTTEDTNMQSLFSTINTATTLISQLEHYKSIADVSVNADDYERFSNHITDIRKIISSRIEQLTQHQLIFSDKYTGAKNEVLLRAEAGGYHYGLWVNLAKNPRIKDIDFQSMTIEIGKNVAMASLAIRMMIMPFSPTYDQFTLLSPAMSCEFFQNPAPPKHISSLTLRQYSTQMTLVPLAYPLRTVTQAQPPLGFTMKIDTSLLPEDLSKVTVIKIDDIKDSEALISNVEVDKENGLVKFNCKTTGVFALAVPKYSHFPIQFWELNTTKENTAELYIKTNLGELNLVVDEKGLVSLESPVSFSGLTPPQALEFLQRHGINIEAPANNDMFGALEAKLSEKTHELEDMLAWGLADAVTGFRIRYSKWNSQVQEDRAVLLARPINIIGEEITDDEEPETPHGAEEEQHPEEEQHREQKKSGWSTILAKATHINLVQYSENLEEADFKPLEDHDFHQHLLPMLMDIASEEVQQRTHAASPFLSESIRYLARKLRLFSVTV